MSGPAGRWRSEVDDHAFARCADAYAVRWQRPHDFGDLLVGSSRGVVVEHQVPRTGHCRQGSGVLHTRMSKMRHTGKFARQKLSVVDEDVGARGEFKRGTV